MSTKTLYHEKNLTLNSCSAHNYSPMIVLLGHFSTKAPELTTQSGFDEFVSKPLDKEVLMGLLSKAGMEKHKTRELQFDKNNNQNK